MHMILHVHEPGAYIIIGNRIDDIYSKDNDV